MSVEIYTKTSSGWTEDVAPGMQADFTPVANISSGLMKRVKLWRLGQGAHGADLASATTLGLNNATGDLVDVTGTTTITAITLADGQHRTVRFTGILTLTHGASLVLPRAANIVTAAGDYAIFRGYASSVVRCVGYFRATAAAERADIGLSYGKQTAWIPASAMIPALTNGPSSAQLETATNKQNYSVLDFDATTSESAHFQVAMPKNWNEGTITYQPFWSSTATDTDGVTWSLQAVAISDNEAIDAAFGTAVDVADACQSAAGEVYVGAESAAVTIAGTPAAGDVCFFKIFRDVADANDTASEDARLIGIKLLYTVDAGNDD